MVTFQLFVLFLMILNFDASTSTHVQCTFGSHGYYVFTSEYQCEITNNLDINSEQSAVIQSANGTHESGKSNDDVTGFYAVNKNVDYFPQGLEKIFPNLKVIRFSHGKMYKVQQSDLKPFPKLVELYFHYSPIEILEDGLFDYNPELAVVAFYDCDIFHIDANVFEPLKKLIYLWLNDNRCINMVALGSSSGVQNIINTAKTKCKNQEYLDLNQKLKELDYDSNNINFTNVEIVKNEIHNLEDQFGKSSIKNCSLIAEKIRELLGENDRQIFLLSKRIDEAKKIMNTSNAEIITRVEKIKNDMSNSTPNLIAQLKRSHSELLSTMNIKVENLETRLKSTSSDLLNLTELMNKKIQNQLDELKNGNIQALQEMQEAQKVMAEDQKKNEQTQNQRINKLESTMEDYMTKMLNRINRIQEIQEAQAQNQKVNNLELKLDDYMMKILNRMKQTGADNQDEFKVIKRKIDRSSEVHDKWKATLIACCTFLVSLLIFLTYKKILMRALR